MSAYGSGIDEVEDAMEQKCRFAASLNHKNILQACISELLKP